MMLIVGDSHGDQCVGENERNEDGVHKNCHYRYVVSHSGSLLVEPFSSESQSHHLTYFIATPPSHARRSFTFDHSSDLMRYKVLEDGMGARCWFCSPWQKGAIENINKRIRQYLHSNTDMTQVSQSQLIALAHNLYATRRKRLGFKTPAEVFATLLKEAA